MPRASRSSGVEAPIRRRTRGFVADEATKSLRDRGVVGTHDSSHGLRGPWGAMASPVQVPGILISARLDWAGLRTLRTPEGRPLDGRPYARSPWAAGLVS